MSSSGEKIANLIQGQTPSLIDTAKGNELINKINSLLNIRIRESEDDDVESQISYSANDVVITLRKQEVSEGGSIEGFTEHETFICVNGFAQKKIILVKDV